MGAGDGNALELLSVQPPGGRPMGAAEYLRGHRAAVESCGGLMVRLARLGRT